MKLVKLSVVAAVALGGLVAFSNLAQAQDTGKEKKGKKGYMSVEQRMERLTTELKLTDEQKPKVKALLEDQQKKMQEMRKEGTPPDREKMREMRTDMEKRMKEILKPDQFEKWQKMMEEERSKRGKKGGEQKSEEKKQ